MCRYCPDVHGKTASRLTYARLDMSDAKSDGFPRRDADGRIVRLPDLIGTALGGLVIGVLALVVLDWGFDLIGGGDFGQANGWLAVILPVWLFVEEFRAWGPGPARIAAALLAAAVGIIIGLIGAGVANALPPLVTGVFGAGLFALAYALVWFVGVRWLAARLG